MQLKEGGYYRRRDGLIAGPAENRGELWSICGNHYEQAHGGLHRYNQRDFDLIAEVTVTPVLPFELRAGGKYTTAEGPLLELREPHHMRYGDAAINVIVPFSARIPGDRERAFYVSPTGQAVRYSGLETLQITGEYVEPKPPTPLERLQAIEIRWGKLKSDNDHFQLYRNLHAIIADLKAEASK